MSIREPGMSGKRWLVISVIYLSSRYVTEEKVATIGHRDHPYEVYKIFWL